MDTIQDLLAKRAEIDRKIADARREERASAIAKVRTLMAEHGLTAADITAKVSTVRAKDTPSKVAAKYRNQATGDTWSGRGLQPKWLRAAIEGGAKIEDFLIAS
ncbi:H-NS family nucleoid-associated regulatory protein [Ideonella sp. A 288]|uniref:H-NS histone family protein n=1 Tax=Ideonella sp. A 288 TaxID=1962181 RepID=UPI000B4B2EC1|nr:H-NS histone family protein [Ideonella sp. A 288]